MTMDKSTDRLVQFHYGQKYRQTWTWWLWIKYRQTWTWWLWIKYRQISTVSLWTEV